MKIIFRDASGLSIQGEFVNNDKVLSATKFLSEKLEIPQASIRFFMTNPRERHFCLDNISLNSIVDKGYAYFVIFPNISLTQLDEKLINTEAETEQNNKNNKNLDSNQNPRSKYHPYQKSSRNYLRHEKEFSIIYDTKNNKIRQKLKHDISDSFINLIINNKSENRFHSPKRYMQYSSSNSLLRVYNRAIQSPPRNLDHQIQQLHQMGFDIEDCKEALRACNFDVERASEYIVGMNRPNNRRFMYGFNRYDDDFDSFTPRIQYISELRLREIMLRRSRRESQSRKTQTKKTNDSGNSNDEDQFNFRDEIEDDTSFMPYRYSSFYHYESSQFLDHIMPIIHEIYDDLSPDGPGVDNRVLTQILRYFYIEMSNSGIYNSLADELIALIRQRRMNENELSDEYEEEESISKSPTKNQKSEEENETKSTTDKTNKNKNENNNSDDFGDFDYFHFDSEDTDDDDIDFDDEPSFSSLERIISMYERSRHNYDFRSGRRRRRINNDVMEAIERIEDLRENLENDDFSSRRRFLPSRARKTFNPAPKKIIPAKSPKLKKDFKLESSKCKKDQSDSSSTSSTEETETKPKLNLTYSFLFDEADDTDNNLSPPKKNINEHKLSMSKKSVIEIVGSKYSDSFKKSQTQTQANNPPPPPPPPLEHKNPYKKYSDAKSPRSKSIDFNDSDSFHKPPPPPPPQQAKKHTKKKAPTGNSSSLRRDINEEDMNFLTEFSQRYGLPLEAIIDAYQQVGNNRQALQDFFL